MNGELEAGSTLQQTSSSLLPAIQPLPKHNAKLSKCSTRHRNSFMCTSELDCQWCLGCQPERKRQS